MASDFEEGMLLGVLVGEGHFGGDGRQPQVTLRMHERHAPLFRWIERAVPGGRLYGPYDHGGRRYYQWMARGPYLRDVLLPILDRRLTPAVDVYAYDRFVSMKAQYRRQLGLAPPPGDGTSHTSGSDGRVASSPAVGSTGSSPQVRTEAAWQGPPPGGETDLDTLGPGE